MNNVASGQDVGVARADVLDDIEIPDQGLQRAVLRALGKRSGDNVTAAEMASLTVLDVVGEGIEDLTGLDAATGLSELSLRRNRIIDLGPLAGLTGLAELDLRTNSIANVDALAGLVNLEVLLLSDNEIVDTGALAGLNNVTHLDLGGNEVTDISFLGTPESLETLDLRNNPLSRQSVDVHVPELRSAGVVVLVNDDHGNSRETATPLTLGEAVAGRVDPHYDRDFFRFEVSEPVDAALFIRGDVDGRLLDESGVPLEPDNDGRAHLFERRFDPGTYYLEIGGRYAGDYLVGAVVVADVAIRDDNLRRELQAALGKSSDETISSVELARLSHLAAPEGTIADLSGLEFAIGLQDVFLWENDISDISPLSGLVHLKSLYLSRNPIEDITPLMNLNSLTRLGLGGLSIADLVPLEGMTGLVSLDISDNAVSDISIIASFSNVEYLTLGGNHIADISPLMALEKLKRLDIRHNPLNSEATDVHIPALQERGVVVEPLEDDYGDTPATAGTLVLGEPRHGSLDVYYDEDYFRLVIEETAVVDIFTVGFLRSTGRLLDEVGLELDRDNHDGAKDHFSIRRTLLPGTYYVVVGGAADSDYYTLAAAVDVVEVDIPDSSLRRAVETALGKFQGGAITSGAMEVLTRLYARGAGIIDLSGIEFATRLTDVRLPNNSIADLSPLARLENLEILDLTNNRIVDTSPLAELPDLKRLHLGGNRIEDVSALGQISSLQVIVLANNSIRDVTPLAGLANLRSLDLGGNDVEDVAPLTALSGLGRLDIRSNPLNEDSIAVHVPALQQDGVDVVRFENDHGEIARLATSVALGVRTRGVIEPYYDVDYFRFDIAEQVEAAVIVSGAGGHFVNVRTLDESMTELDRVSAGDVAPRSNILIRRSFEPGSYFLEVSATRERRAFEYGVSVIEVVDVDIPDDGLRRTVLRRLYGSEADRAISSPEMARLDEASRRQADIADLTGLEFALHIRDIRLSDNDIEDLAPLRPLTGLKSLFLGNNRIVDISPLEGLTELWTMTLSDNLISDISPLAGLSSLEFVDLDGNRITALPSLTGLIRLRDLDLRDNDIVELAALADLTSLARLDLANNAVSDLSPIAELTNLGSLYLQGNQISDISALANLQLLSEVDLRGNDIVDISPLLGLERLVNVQLENNPLSVESSQRHIPALRSRGVWVQGVDDHGDTRVAATPLALDETSYGEIGARFDKDYFRIEIPTETHVVLSSTGIGRTAGRLLDETGGELAWSNSDGNDLNFLIDRRLGPGTYYLEVTADVEHAVGYGVTAAILVDMPDPVLLDAVRKNLYLQSGDRLTSVKLRSMKELRVFDTDIADLTGLELATGLTSLILPRNAIKDISPIASLTALTYLDLRDNVITDLSPISSLTVLTTLRLSGNAIIDISALSALKVLPTLNLTGNLIANIEALSGATSIEFLFLSDNRIVDLEPLRESVHLEYLFLANNKVVDVSPLAGLTALRRLDLRRNPLGEDSLDVQVPRLVGRGVEVAVHDDHHDSLEGASRLVLGDVIEGDLEVFYDADYFRLELDRTLDVAVFTTGPLDIEGRLIDSQGVEIARGREVGSRNFLIQYRLSPGTYYVEVTSALYGTGSYTIRAVENFNVAFADVTLRSAISLVVPGSTTITAGELGTLRHLRVSNAGISSLSGLEHAVGLSSLILNDNRIADISPVTNLRDLVWLDLRRNPLNTATTNVHIPALQAKGVVFALEDDHGDSPAMAAALALDGRAQGEIDPPYDSDYFRLDVVATVQVDLYTSGIQTVIRLYAGSRLLADSDWTGVSRVRRHLEPGTYYVRVDSVRDAVGEYVLHAAVTPGVAPANVRVVADGTDLIVSWTAIAGVGVTGYRVIATPADGSATLTCTTDADQARCVVSGVTRDVVYAVEVQAFGNNGQGPFSMAIDGLVASPSSDAEPARSFWRGWRLALLNPAEDVSEEAVETAEQP